MSWVKEIKIEEALKRASKSKNSWILKNDEKNATHVDWGYTPKMRFTIEKDKIIVERYGRKEEFPLVDVKRFYKTKWWRKTNSGKNTNIHQGGNVSVKIPEWLIKRQEFFNSLPKEIKKGIEEGSGKDLMQIIGKIERETEKAILITDAKLWCEHSKKWPPSLGEKKIWLPKSQIEIKR